MNRLTHKTLLAGLALSVAAPLVKAAEPANPAPGANETPAERDARMQWWREARFGMFIHWGLYSIPAGEWNGKRAKGYAEWIMNKARIPKEEYEKLQAQFNPTKYDPAAWVALAKSAGMKYIVITSKHHDGFCLFESEHTDYDMSGTPYRRDLLRPLAEECHRQGIRICWYHSIMDWHHPLAGGKSFPEYVAHMKNQCRELLTNYGDIGVMWFDGEWIRDRFMGTGHGGGRHPASLPAGWGVLVRSGGDSRGGDARQSTARPAGLLGRLAGRLDCLRKDVRAPLKLSMSRGYRLVGTASWSRPPGGRTSCRWRWPAG